MFLIVFFREEDEDPAAETGDNPLVVEMESKEAKAKNKMELWFKKVEQQSLYLELRLWPGGQYSQLGLIWEDLECSLVHSIVVNHHNILYFRPAKCQNSLYIGKFYIILFIL